MEVSAAPGDCEHCGYGADCGVESLRSSCWLLATGQRPEASSLLTKMFHLLLFLFFGAICVAGAVNLLVQSHPINSALSLVAVMASLAAEYLLLGAEFVAAVQVIVYAGAIMVLFVITIMLLNAGAEERTKGSRIATLLGVPGVTVGAVLVAWTLLGRSATTHSVSIGALWGAPRDIAR